MDPFKKKISRRQVIKGGALVGAGLLVPWETKVTQALARAKGSAFKTTLSTIPLAPADPPIPQSKFFTAPMIAHIPVATPLNKVDGIAAYYQIRMRQGSWKFHPELPATPTWGYDDTRGGYIGYLGPTIEARRNEQIVVKWINDLPADPEAPFGLSDSDLVPLELLSQWGRAVVHVHGGHNPQPYDGGPEHYMLAGTETTYYYPNIQQAGFNWYHDHAIGVTRTNAYAGLAGLYFIRDQYEDRLKIPKGAYEIPMVLQDKAFYWDGGAPGVGNLQLWYPNPWIPEAFGNCMVVNAQLWPVMEVERRRYRFRILNASQARFLNLRISDAPGSWVAGPPVGTRIPNSVLPFWVIGMEGGFLPYAVRKNSLLVGNAERPDVIVDFSKMDVGRELYLSNDAMTPFDPSQPPLDPDNPDPNPIYSGDTLNVMQFMKFKVVPASGPDRTYSMPANIKPLEGSASLADVRVKRNITLVEAPFIRRDGTDTGFMKVLLQNREFMHTPEGSVISETPKLGSTEIWQFINLTPDTHPMHVHLTMFQVLNRQKLTWGPGGYDPDTTPYKIDFQGAPHAFTGNIPAKYLDGPPRPPEPEEAGFKDTVKANPGEVTRVVAKFEHFTGAFVYHCHILEHEENDMMQYFMVKPWFGKEGEEVQPTEIALDQNYPNPFNPETTIRFQIPEDTHVQLKVFDNLGREVATLMDQQLTAGMHSVNWNASNFASGVYHYRMAAGNVVTTKSMVLVK